MDSLTHVQVLLQNAGMVNEYGKSMESRGGFGLANAVTKQLLKHQEAELAPSP